MQLSAIRELVRTRVGLNANDAMSLDAALNSLINTANRQINLVRDWPWLERIATVQAPLALNGLVSGLPTNFRKAIGLSHGSRDLPFRQPRLRPSVADFKGPPQAFTRGAANQVYVLPAPDQDYTLDLLYIATEPALVNNTDVPSIPGWAIDLLVAQTCLLVARRFRNSEQVAQYQVERGEAVANIVSELAVHTQGQKPMRVGERTGIF